MDGATSYIGQTKQLFYPPWSTPGILIQSDTFIFMSFCSATLIHQADTILLGYPVQRSMDRKVRINDLITYQKVFVSGPFTAVNHTIIMYSCVLRNNNGIPLWNFKWYALILLEGRAFSVVVKGPLFLLSWSLQESASFTTAVCDLCVLVCTILLCTPIYRFTLCKSFSVLLLYNQYQKLDT